MPGSVLVCARPLPNPHWHTSKFFEFSGSGYHKCGGDTGSLSPGTNSDLVTEAPYVVGSPRSPSPNSGGTVCDHGTNRSPTLGFIPLECLPHGVCDRHATVTISPPRGLS